MDKTTTWLVRGASLVVIFIGFIVLKPYFQIQEEIRRNERFDSDNRKANERCNKKERISYYKFLDLVNSGVVKRIQFSVDGELSEIETNDGNFVVSLAPNSDLLSLLDNNNIQLMVGSKGLCK